MVASTPTVWISCSSWARMEELVYLETKLFRLQLGLPPESCQEFVSVSDGEGLDQPNS
jgi:hypothetical protein